MKQLAAASPTRTMINGDQPDISQVVSRIRQRIREARYARRNDLLHALGWKTMEHLSSHSQERIADALSEVEVEVLEWVLRELFRVTPDAEHVESAANGQERF